MKGVRADVDRSDCWSDSGCRSDPSLGKGVQSRPLPRSVSRAPAGLRPAPLRSPRRASRWRQLLRERWAEGVAATESAGREASSPTSKSNPRPNPLSRGPAAPGCPEKKPGAQAQGNCPVRAARGRRGEPAGGRRQGAQSRGLGCAGRRGRTVGCGSPSRAPGSGALVRSLGTFRIRVSDRGSDAEPPGLDPRPGAGTSPCGESPAPMPAAKVRCSRRRPASGSPKPPWEGGEEEGWRWWMLGGAGKWLQQGRTRP